jgi:hypothetical protein
MNLSCWSDDPPLHSPDRPYPLTPRPGRLLRACTRQSLSGAQALIVSTPFGTMLCVIVATFLVHATCLALNTVVVLLLRLDPPEAACITITGSQKARRTGACRSGRARAACASRRDPSPALH